MKVLYAPVSAWGARLDDDDPERLGPQGVALQCDRLTATQIVAPGTNVRAWGLDAAGTSGSTRADGQGFSATGTRMTYDQTKGLLVLEGDGLAHATLYREERPGQQSETLRSSRIQFWPATHAVQVQGFDSLQFPSLPDGQKGGRSPMPGRR